MIEWMILLPTFGHIKRRYQYSTDFFFSTICWHWYPRKWRQCKSNWCWRGKTFEAATECYGSVGSNKSCYKTKHLITNAVFFCLTLQSFPETGNRMYTKNREFVDILPFLLKWPVESRCHKNVFEKLFCQFKFASEISSIYRPYMVCTKKIQTKIDQIYVYRYSRRYF